MTKLILLADADYVALAFIQNRSAERAENYGFTPAFAALVTREEQNYMRRGDMTDASNMNMLCRSAHVNRSAIEHHHHNLAGIGLTDAEYLEAFHHDFFDGDPGVEPFNWDLVR